MDIADSWSNDMESVLDNIRKNSLLLSEHHKKAYLYYRSYLKYFRIPTIILSALNSVISIGLSAYVPQNFVSEITCVVSLVCGIITSIELYLNIQKYMESELMMSKDFYILSTDIFKALALDRANRGMDGKTFLDNNYSTYCKLIENSNVSTSEMADNLTPIKLTIKNGNISTDTDNDIESQPSLNSLNKLNISATNFNIEPLHPKSPVSAFVNNIFKKTYDEVDKKIEKPLQLESVKEQLKEKVKEQIKEQVKDATKKIKVQTENLNENVVISMKPVLNISIPSTDDTDKTDTKFKKK
jgi:hypothetical protein